MAPKTRVVTFGVGVIGQEVVKNVIKRNRWIELVGALDNDPKKVGRDLGDVVGLGKELGIRISNDPEALFSDIKVDEASHRLCSIDRVEKNAFTLPQFLQGGFPLL